ncbi:MAG: hypothetical protein COB49_03060 [Alphaproteobacteria bacterium]|nr:MAG: hypothetical protein COB49_03060 [Alphaproteobacteria bacterium]
MTYIRGSLVINFLLNNFQKYLRKLFEHNDVHLDLPDKGCKGIYRQKYFALTHLYIFAQASYYGSALPMHSQVLYLDPAILPEYPDLRLFY